MASILTMMKRLDRLEQLARKRQPPKLFDVVGMLLPDDSIVPMDFGNGGPGEPVPGMVFDPEKVRILFDASIAGDGEWAVEVV